ncbi:3-hydroxyacyl-CoA dehydrogenase NAD-binding domain-containing protein [Baekduia sp.]|jgi:3-hydroxybutyryl-CoA dehydrogenase|uniref:3-hydroxyacyl-CoA dehydrogenase NAD-binding domain-containing protein n=1 Tax=Baekduia sp. TaxID=2600305 RepID=UPI002E01A0F8|nr:3-hydroxyacyl-CoA dehydrogenase NAD-binding domain-containing protein [Baekduia sp.]
MSAPQVIGVVGAGTMGSGIAQLAAQGGARTLLFDAVEGAAAAGVERARAGIVKLVEKGVLFEDAGVIATRLEVAGALEELAPCGLIIEAAPERLEVKHELFAALSHIAPRAVLASNTSSIPITAIARAAADPSRVVGLHFFNPAPLMQLVELIAGLQSSEEALAVARAAGEAMGRRVIEATDGPGFLVNRCNRPFGLEALRLLQEKIADVETIDAIVRAAGFRMGPFELQDLVGIDVGFEVAKSFYELSFGEPRWRPSPLSAQMVDAGRLGRKTGQGWYTYDNGTPHRVADPDAPEPGVPAGVDGPVLISGFLPIADELRALADDAGFTVANEADGAVPWLILECGPPEDDAAPLQGAPRALLCAEGALQALDQGAAAAGFHALSPVGLVELTQTEATADVAAQRTEAFFSALGLPTAWVADAPGLVLGRIIAQVINECAFAVGESIGTAADIDAGMKLGMNYPTGPLAWADEIGLDHIVMVLDGLREEYGEERYRTAPLLRRITAFHEHEHFEHDHGEP